MKKKSAGAFIFVSFILGFLTYHLTIADNSSKFSTYYHQKRTMFEAMPNNENEIIFLGNSITDGCEWSEFFEDTRIKNRGISGDIAEGILYRLSEVTESKPLQIFLMIGINDLASGQTPKEIFSNIEKIVGEINSSSPNTGIFIQSVLPVNDKFERFKNHVDKSAGVLNLNELLKNFCDEENIAYIDLYSHFINEEGKLDLRYTNDGLHLTGEGYILWKSLIKKFIAE